MHVRGQHAHIATNLEIGGSDGVVMYSNLFSLVIYFFDFLQDDVNDVNEADDK